MINALWRLTLTIIFLLSLALILAIVWEVPAVLGYTLPAELVKLPTTLLILLAMVTGIWGTWSRPATIRKTIEDQKPAHTTQ